VQTRVSQLNGCAFCLDMHARDLRKHGETDAIIFGAPTCMCSASAQFKITGQRAQEYGHAGRVPRREQRQTLSQSCKASP
jgi:AhpD family alkylhydroperoxidase